jgi:ppGpp synthetase/RelA/SpoT-type nucleotidyltranferase
VPANKRPTPEQISEQVKAYVREFPHYKTYAEALKRVLQRTCEVSIPEVLVQARPKSVPSFVEKYIRKFERYPDPVRQMTDLCGGRVIVQTLEQVKAVKLFVEHNFAIIERDDKGLLLSEDKFGYRDMHYLVKLLPGRERVIGLTEEECQEIGGRVAELQVRSLVQHAWADILHDRMYKAPLRLSAEAKRTGALLAAIMEDGDRSFDRLALEVDGMVANYTAYVSGEDADNEIKIQEMVLQSGRNPEEKLRGALQLARLLGPCGEYGRVVEILEPFASTEGALRCELLSSLGHALCRLHRGAPVSEAYCRGQQYLREAVDDCAGGYVAVVPNFRKQKSMHARALSQLAWSWEAVPGGEGRAREGYRRALETEPGNPYHLTNQLGFEIFCERKDSMIDSMRTVIRQAIATCREHALAGTELPYALFAAGRLSLLLGDAGQALGWYSRGLQHLFDGKSCVPEAMLEDEVHWVQRIHFGSAHPPESHGWIERLIILGKSFRSTNLSAREVAASAKPKATEAFLIVAGGAGGMDAEMLLKVRPCLEKALESFCGTVISGGTTVGIPGCVGEFAAKLKQEGRKNFELVGYIPKHLPEDAPRDGRYDRFVVVSEDSGFSPGQILRTWEDLMRTGVAPDRVMVLGFGGGPLTGVEYRVALALGASVAVVAGSGGGAGAILTDPVWTAVPSLLELPLDQASVQALVTSPSIIHAPEKIQEMAQEFHMHYVNDNPKKLPEKMRPWENLPDALKKANLEQARYAVEILRAAAFDVRAATGGSDAIKSFSRAEFTDDVERMAELEHGRWNIERLRDGWRFGTLRDDAKKIHDCLISWQQLPDAIRNYDRNGVRAFPDILARAGFEVYRKSPLLRHID